MPCDPQELRHVPLFALLDDEELAVLAAQVELKKFAARQRIYKIGDPGKHAYILMSGTVHVTTATRITRRSSSTSPAMVSSSVSPPCSTRRPTRRTPSPSKRPSVSRSAAKTLP